MALKLQFINENSNLDSDIIDEQTFSFWNHKIIENNFFTEENIKYHIYNSKKILFILPGLSSKSLSWTIGRISYYLK